MELSDLNTIPQAIKYLSDKTGREWSVNFLSKALIIKQFTLQALPADNCNIVVRLFTGVHEELVSTQYKVWEVANLNSLEVEQLFKSGITYAKHTIGHEELIHTKLPDVDNPLDLDAKFYKQTEEFTPPIKVTLDQVRISAAIIIKIETDKESWPIASKHEAKNSEQTKAIPISKQALQEQEILRYLNELGFEPSKLPNYKNGQPTVKKQVKEELIKNKKLFTARSFLHAWERLRKDKEIVNIN